jgi:hypothetical protein
MELAHIECNGFGIIEFSGPNGNFSCPLMELAGWIDLGNRDPIEWSMYTLEGMCKNYTMECGAYVDPEIIGNILLSNPLYVKAARKGISYLNRLWDDSKRTMAEVEELQYEYGIHPNQKLSSLIGCGAPALVAKTYGCSDEAYHQEFAGDDGIVGPTRKYHIGKVSM